MTKELPFLSKAALLAERPPVTRELVIENYGKVKLRGLKAAEREELDNMANQRKDGQLIQDYRMYRTRAVAFALIDEAGQAMFDNPIGEAALLNQLPAIVVDRMFQVVDELSGLTKKTQDALGKDSKATESVAS